MAKTRKTEYKNKVGNQSKTTTVYVTKVAVVVLLLLLQVFFWIWFYGVTKQYILYWKTAAIVLSASVVLYLVNKDENPAYTLIWVLVVTAAPVVGGLLYISIAGNRTRMKFVKEATQNHLDMFAYMPKDAKRQREIAQLSQSAAVQSTYISKTAGFPVYKNTSVKYFPLGERNYEQLLYELEQAKHFIFMEYFIIKEGQMWDRILEILEKKAAEGLDVRLIYDDFGCSMWIPSRFNKDMEERGIHVAAFNPIGPFLNLRQNNRDHRKITVIDGYVGFTGGINLADEYINVNCRFGHWKDTGVMLKGEAVWNLTLMFLQTWFMLTGQKDDYSAYEPNIYQKEPFYSDGYIQPYGDTPVDDEIVSENIYLNMINKAKHYIYITTPYLIIDHEMVTALCLAAKSGIDVRIITPGIPDKKLVYMVTQSYYATLIAAGVRIYQYTPGFIHAKTVVADDKVATVGTVNFDYRSLYLHFECGVWMFHSGVIYDIKEDYLQTLKVCHEVTAQETQSYGMWKRFGQSILRLIAPLM